MGRVGEGAFEEVNLQKLARVYEGWERYQTSLLHAVAPLKPDHLNWRPAPHRRSVGELVRHVSLGRVNWFARMPAPGIDDATKRVPDWATDGDGNRHAVESSVPADDAPLLASWLQWSWEPVRRALHEWTTDDLATTYRHRFRGKTYAVSRQWTIWRIMAHDIHHGGQIARILAERGIEAFELRALGGHTVEPPRASGQS